MENEMSRGDTMLISIDAPTEYPITTLQDVRMSIKQGRNEVLVPLSDFTLVTIPETDIDGNPIYQTIDGVQVPVYTHNQEYKYSEPVRFLGNIYDTGGSVEQRPYGHDYETFGGMLVMAKGELPINDGSLIWEKSEPVLLQDGTADPLSADWRVRRASDSINESRYSLERVTKNERH